MDFRPVIANHKTTKKFEGALPTSIFKENNVVEIFGKNPDIDSTALMIYATSWILFKLLGKKENANNNSERLLDLNKKLPLLYLYNIAETKKIKTSKIISFNI
jgi:hypothetical protein